MENEHKKVLENAGEKEFSKDTRKIMMVIAVITGAIAIAIITGFCIYNMPENRLARTLDLGQKYLLEEDYEQAIVEFNKALEIDSKNVDAYLGIADAYTGMENVEATIAVLEQGYELTENEKIWQKLDEMRNSIVETESAEMEESIVGEDNVLKGSELEGGELPYYELGFSPEDFTLADYSVMDGDHLGDIVKVLSEAMPNWEDTWGNVNYTGFSYEYHNYYDGGAVVSYGSQGISTIVYESEIEPGVILLRINGGDNILDIPFWKGKVIPGVTSFEDTLDILEIRKIIQETNELERFDYYEFSGLGEYGDYIATFKFESQYGNTNCRCVYSEEGSLMFCRISVEEWDLVLSIWDNMLDSIVIVCGLQE